MNPPVPAQEPEMVAIIGMAGRFPGASSVEELWSNLVGGVETIRRFSPEELEHSVGSPELRAAGRRLVGARGVLDGVELFDAAFFGVYPREAEVMDPQHRLFLECAWEALERAGYDPAAHPGLVGVYAGSSINSYLLYHLCRDRAFAANFAANYQTGAYTTMLGNDKDFLATRVSYKLNLKGPSLAIQTACSTSLVAVSQACTALVNYQCDLALAGGVSVTFPQRRDYVVEADGMASSDGTCRTFDAQACGTVFGHGAGLVVLKRLSEAVADRDNILAVIRGWALNNDGADKIGYAAPSVKAQADVIALAQAAAGVDPASVSYVEAHGTATPLGDPIEVAALTEAFRRGGAAGTGYCAIASGKTHFGHLDVAAGVTGLIKTVLQLQHEQIPPLLHFRTPNPRIAFNQSPFYPVRELLPWKRGPHPRRAGVSAFGVGGTNAHVVVEEAPPLPTPSASRPHHLWLLSARTPTALAQSAHRLADHLEREVAVPLADAAFTLQVGRRSFRHRAAVVAASRNEAVARWRAAATEQADAPPAPEQRPPVVFLFPGQGAQAVNMGRALYLQEPVFRREVDRCAAWLQTPLQLDLRTILYPQDPDDAEARRLIGETWITQPAIFTVEYALARLWESWGIRPDVLIGHSIGEYVCAVLAGSLELPAALSLLAVRAQLMQRLPAGAMLAVRLPAEEVLPLLPRDVCLAAENSARTCTLAGPTEAVRSFAAQLRERNIASRLLDTSHAFHSPMMDPILGEITAAAGALDRRPPTVRWVSTCTGEELAAAELGDPAYWARQLRQPVRFSQALARVLTHHPVVLLEVGPGQTLTQLAAQHPQRASHVQLVSSLPGNGEALPELLDAMGRLWRAGVQPDWSGYYAGEERRRVLLPTYPFERQRFWIEPVRPASAGTNPDDQPHAAAPAPEPATSPQVLGSGASSPADRPEVLRTQVRTLIRDLSGTEVANDLASFIEMGYDSLFLTQASQALQIRFGVKISFRELLGSLGSVTAIARHLDQCLPSDAPLSRERPTADCAPAAGSRGRTVRWPGDQPPRAGGGAKASFGPYRPLEKNVQGGLTPRQQEAVERLIARYTARTPGSKAFTARHRSHFADPRAVAGFKAEWKEMIYPIVSARSKGARLWDVDGHEYIDITMGFGTYFFGHSPDWLQDAIRAQLDLGMAIGPQSPLAGRVAELLGEFTGLERVAFCNTGSEAVMAAMRVARTVTGRSRVVYFTGDYHGMFEEVLVRGAWIDGNYRAQPVAPGIPASLAENILVLEYGAPESLEIIRSHAEDIAAVLVEPVQSRSPRLQPRQFLQQLRALTSQTGIALIFDEIVTGFRCHPGGAQTYFGIRADLATYGKVIGGGLPIGVLAGQARFMDALDGGSWQYGDDSYPAVGVTFFAGTFVRHPLALAAAEAVLQRLKREGGALQQRLNERVARLSRTLDAHFEQAGVPLRFPSFGSIAMIEYPPELKFGSLLWYFLREKGVHVWEGRPCVFTEAHTDQDFDGLIAAFATSVAEMQAGGLLPEPPARQARASAPDGTGTSFPRLDRAPLTEAQREIFFSTQMGAEANCAYNESIALHLHGSLDRPALHDALQHLIDRHPALRSTFSPDGQWQFFADRAEASVENHDWSGTPAAEGQSRLAALLAEEMGRPFDLVKGPLLRLHIVRLGPDEHIVVFNAHHLVCDGWSIGMWVAELASVYNARRAGRIALLPPPMSFADFARAQHMEAASAARQATADYWVSQYRDGAPVLELPTDRPRPPLKTYAGAMRTRRLEPARVARLKADAAARGGTLFCSLLTSFATLLHRLTGQEDVSVGVPAAGQAVTGCSELIGHCLNFLPLRLRPRAQLSWREFAREVQGAVFEAYEHQNYTYGSLLKELKLPRDTSRLPLVSVMFNIDKSGFELVRFDGLQAEVRATPKRFVNFDLFFNLVQGEDSLEVECEYNTDLFDGATIDHWLECFEVLAEESLKRADQRLDELVILSETAREQLLHTHNDTRREHRPAVTLPDLFTQAVQAHPNRIAVRCAGQILTYAQLAERVAAVEATLRARGARSGVLIGLFLERSIDLLVAPLAVMRTGAAYVPMDPVFPGDRLAAMIKDAGLSVIVTQSSLASALPPHQAELIKLDEAARPALSRVAVPALVAGDDVAYVIYTSGSTGRPKGVQVTHRALSNFLRSMAREPGIDREDVLLAVTTFSFDIAGLELFLPLIVGATVAIAPPGSTADGHRLREELGRCGATVMQATPGTWRLLLEADWPGSRTFKILVGGESVPRDLVNQLVPRCGSIWNMYGPTETTIWSTVERLDHGSGPVLIGRPIDNTQVYVVNSRLQPQPLGVPGELLIGGHGVAAGYWKRPELTAEKFIPDPFGDAAGGRLYRTGDLARWRTDGRLECLGRLDFQVKVRGFRIELGEIEEALGRHPQVKEAAVTVWEDRPGQKRLAAYVVPAGSSPPDVGLLRAHLERILPSYMMPANYLFLPALPRTPNGKIDRRALPAKPAPDEAEVRIICPPRNPRERALAEIWRDVLQREDLGVHDDIFELGGDSILVFQIAARASRSGLPLTPAEVFRRRTIAALCDEAGRAPDAAAPTVTAPTITRVDRAAFRRGAPPPPANQG